MEFYKEGKRIGLTAGQRFVFNDAQYNHKGVIVEGDGVAALKFEFWTKGEFSQGTTFIAGVASTSSFTNNLIPVRLAAVTSDTTGINIFLLN